MHYENLRGTRFYLAKVRFATQKNGKIILGEKRYDYYINNIVIAASQDTPVTVGLNEIPLYHITNENGYDYRNSLVFIEEIIHIYQTEMKTSILNITKLTRATSINRDKVEGLTYKIGKRYLNIDDKEHKDAISTLLQNAKVQDSFNELTTEAKKASSTIEDLIEVANFKETKIIEKKDKGENKMRNFANKFNFGPATSVRMSLYGPAFPSGSNERIAYNKATGTWIEVTEFCFDFDKCCYVMPVAVKDIKENDFILHNGNFVRVAKRNPDNSLVVEKIYSNEVVTIFPVKNLFGFDFYTKLVCLMDNMVDNASTDNPFGNPMALMMLMNDRDGSSFKEILPFMMMSNMAGAVSGTETEGENTTTPAFPFGEILNNPMMLYFFMKD